MKAFQPKGATLAAAHPPDLQVHAFDKRLADAAAFGDLERGKARAPSHFAAAGDFRAPGTVEGHALIKPGGKQQFVHFLVAQQNGAIVIGESRGVAQRSGDGAHQPGHGDGHDQRGDQDFEQSEAVAFHSGCCGASTRGTPVMGSTRTTRWTFLRLINCSPSGGTVPPG